MTLDFWEELPLSRSELVCPNTGTSTCRMVTWGQTTAGFFFFLFFFFSLIIALLRYHSYTVQFSPFKMYNSVAFHIFTELCIHHHSSFSNIFITHRETVYPSAVIPYFSLPQPMATTTLVCRIGLFWTSPISGIVLDVVFYDSLLSLCIMVSRFIHVIV